jgi:hypothetical protein
MPDNLPPWIEALESEDLNFIRRFVTASGSLKEMAEQYNVSYPTIRARMDELIAKVEAASTHAPESTLSRLVRELVASGDVAVNVAKKLIAANKKDVEAAARLASRQ